MAHDHFASTELDPNCNLCMLAQATRPLEAAEPKLAHCTTTWGHSPACLRDGTYCSRERSHAGACTPHGTRIAPAGDGCPDCGQDIDRLGGNLECETCAAEPAAY